MMRRIGRRPCGLARRSCRRCAEARAGSVIQVQPRRTAERPALPSRSPPADRGSSRQEGVPVANRCSDESSRPATRSRAVAVVIVVVVVDVVAVAGEMARWPAGRLVQEPAARRGAVASEWTTPRECEQRRAAAHDGGQHKEGTGPSRTAVLAVVVVTSAPRLNEMKPLESSGSVGQPRRNRNGSSVGRRSTFSGWQESKATVRNRGRCP